MNDLINLRPDKDKDPVFNDNLTKMVKSLSCDVYKNFSNMKILNKVEVTKQYRQSVVNSGIVEVFRSIIEKFLKFKVITMAVVYANDTKLLDEM